jgi:hypothetical protein
MEENMNRMMTRVVKPLSVLVWISMLVGVLALAFPVKVVSAAGLEQDTQPPAADSTPDPARLEKLYQREQRLLEGQANRLERANEIAGRAEERIAQLKADGKDTTAMEEALATFKDQLVQAQTAHDAAAELLNTHAGFDSTGKVTDAATARETVKQAGQDLRETARILRSSIREVLRALREYRRDNR